MSARLMLAAGAMMLAACATQPPATTAAAPDEPDIKDTRCLQHTGSRTLREGRCAIGPGRVYSASDLNRTGGITLQESLDRLLP